MQIWTPISWKPFPNSQAMPYNDLDELDRVTSCIASLPPLVTPWEIERLENLIASAQRGERFILQGGDCAETLEQCNPESIERMLSILMKMSLVLILGAKKPVVPVGRIAGQYGKPRSSLTETHEGITMSSYFGDLVNRPERTSSAREPNPRFLLTCYEHAALTLNFMRSLTSRGFPQLSQLEAWDWSFFQRDGLSSSCQESYFAMTRDLAEALQFYAAVGEGRGDRLPKTEFFTSHEGFHLHYESAQTKSVAGRRGHYDLTTHLPWIGARTRNLSGAHIEFFRGIRNPIGVKLGPNTTPNEVLELCEVLNPENDPGRLIFISRMGATQVEKTLPPLLEAIRRAQKLVLWVCDPMHGNTVTLADGKKTRPFDSMLTEIQKTFDAHAESGTMLGGVHLELSPDEVTECVGAGVDERDLSRAYVTRCDPRLNHAQAIEMAYFIARRLRQDERLPRGDGRAQQLPSFIR
ncbi:MAG TPA: 3-deoxy-7-phosphoheptulonate synthase class II [Polyangium sp.]|nr:3-deoxy-7-phosphoheptulonate synthase class II [Polyangium sp.]